MIHGLNQTQRRQRRQRKFTHEKRYLVLYQFGGVYTDIDAAPGPWFNNGTAIGDDDDAWFVVERIGVLSQYFMSASPGHPLMHLAVSVTLKRLLEVDPIGTQYVPFVTGPGALKEAFYLFTNKYGNGPGGGVDGEVTGVHPAANGEGREDDTESEGNDAGGSGNNDKNATRRRRLSELEVGATQNTTTDNVTQQQQQDGFETVGVASATSTVQVDPAPPIGAEAPKNNGRGGLVAGLYVGMLGRTVTVAGTRRVSNDGVGGCRRGFARNALWCGVPLSRLGILGLAAHACRFHFFLPFCGPNLPSRPIRTTTSTSSGNPSEKTKSSITQLWE
jgi:hypothetical protein